MTVPKMICHNHNCRREFEQHHSNRLFCCQDCRAENLRWRAMRGSVIVNAIMTGDAAAVQAAVDRVRSEYFGCGKNDA